MMNDGKKKIVSSLLFQRESTWFLTLFFFILGISSGVFSELYLETADKTKLAGYLWENLFSQSFSGNNFNEIFMQSAANNLGLLFIIFLSGLTVVGFPAAYLVIAYKGMAMGFSAALLIESLKIKGLFTLLLTVIPQNLILIPVLFIAVVLAVNLARNTLVERKRKSLSTQAGSYIFLFLPLIVGILFAGFMEAFICPTLLQLIK